MGVPIVLAFTFEDQYLGLCIAYLFVVAIGFLGYKFLGTALPDVDFRLPKYPYPMAFIFVWFVGQMAAQLVSAYFPPTSTATSDLVQSQLAIIATVFLAPIVEELVYRFAIFECLQVGFHKRQFGILFAIIASSAFFAFMHASVMHLIPTFLLGVFLCIVYVSTKNILFSIAAHVVYNLLSLYLSGFSVPEFFVSVPFVLFGVILCFAVFGVALQSFFVKGELSNDN